MSAVLADTHALVWYLEADPQLSPTARHAIDAAIGAGEPVYISTISLVEIAYLIEKGRLPADLFDRIFDASVRRLQGLTAIPLDAQIARELRSIPGTVVRDMPDRIVAATAAFLKVPLLTKDSQVQASGVPTIW